MKNNIDKKELIKSEGPRIEKYLKYNYEGVEKVEFTDVFFTPTGIPHIVGFINDDNNISFDAGVYNGRYNAAINWDNDDNVPSRSSNDGSIKTMEQIEEEE